MRLFGRKRSAPVTEQRRDEPAPPAQPLPPFEGTDDELAVELERATELARAGELDGERRLIHLRNQAGIRRLLYATDSAAFPEPDWSSLPPADGLPAFTRDEVDPALLRAAIERDGCLLIRGLIDPAAASWLVTQIDRSFIERDRHDDGVSADAHLYDEFVPDPRFGEELARPWIKAGGGVLASDSPALSFQLLELLRSVRLPELVEGYLGDRALITAQKTTLRKAEPKVPGGWHQDGKFMGPVRALNLWLALSRCGDIAPGLDIVPRRIAHLVTTQTEEAQLDYVASQAVVERIAGDTPVQRPIFEPGDALLFDELFLHKTGSDPAMPHARYAIENWFFGASGFPREYAPIAVE
jgi:hypothetical protein